MRGVNQYGNPRMLSALRQTSLRLNKQMEKSPLCCGCWHRGTISGVAKFLKRKTQKIWKLTVRFSEP